MNWKTKRYKLKNNIVLLTFFLLFAACTQTQEKNSRVEHLPYYGDAEFTPKWHLPNSTDLRGFHKIPLFKLTNQEGKTITEKTFADKIYVTDFFFTTCPGICPKMTNNMAILQEEFLNTKDVLLLSHSVTPEVDSVSVLKDYAENKGIKNEKWHLATGDRKQIYDLGRHSYFVEEDLGLEKTEDDFLHTENFILIDKKRYIRGIYNGLNKTAIQQLIADIKTLKKEG